MKRKISLILVLFVLIMGCVANSVSATLNCGVDMQTAKTEFAKKEQFDVSVKLTGVQTENGIMAFTAVLKYDTNSLKMVGMTGQNGWSNPTYNSANGKFVMDASSPMTTDGVITNIKFEVLDTSVKNPTISLEGIEIANGVDAPITATNKSKSITVTDTTSGGGSGSNSDGGNNGSGSGNNGGATNNPANNTNGGGNKDITTSTTPTTITPNTTPSTTPTTNPTNTVNINNALSNKSNTDLPYTGNSQIVLLTAITSLVIISLVYYAKIKKIDKSKIKYNIENEDENK